MKKMTLGNRILAMLLAFVMILTGIAPGTFNARVVKGSIIFSSITRFRNRKKQRPWMSITTT